MSLASRDECRAKNFSITAVDLFCGAGGLTKGLEMAGIDVKLGVDIDPACKYPYSVNNGARFLLKSVEDLDAKELMDVFESSSLKLLAGCAPCQTFSTYNQKADSSDKRWWLLRQFARLVEETKPDLVTMENVPGLVTQDVFQEFLGRLGELGYEIDYRVIDCAKYGLPQKRNRLVLLASRLGGIEILSSESIGRNPRTVRDAIGDLPPLDAGGVDPNDPLHQSSTLSPLNLQRIKASRPGGTWRDWPRELVTDCHKKKSGKTYPSVYGRMCWDMPSPTMTTQFFGYGNGRFGHPEQHRGLSLREGAILQSFPERYEFVAPGDPVCKKTLGRLIGNAVPVDLGEVIGRSFLEHVRKVQQMEETLN